MRRQALILICVLAAAGCGRWTDLNSDAFAQGNATQEQFRLDSSACTQMGEEARSYEVRGIAADNVDKQAIFNRAYTGCMRAKGYREGTSALSFGRGYDL